MRFLNKIGSKKLYRIQRKDLPSHTYIIVNPSSQKIHFDPTITDFELYKLATECNEAFLKFARKLDLFKGAKAKNICELILVSGGFYYHLNQAFYNVFGYSLPAGFIGVRRILGDVPHGAITYDNLEAVPENSTIIIGDTIATGATLIDSIEYFLKKTPKVKRIVIFTIAGALSGAQYLTGLEKSIKEKYGTDLHVFFSDGIFGLAKNQTDMHYFHPVRSKSPKATADIILAPEAKRAAEKKLGRFLGERLCVIWDWGQRNKDPMGHLKEVVKVCSRLGPRGDKIVHRAQKRLKAREKSL